MIYSTLLVIQVDVRSPLFLVRSKDLYTIFVVSLCYKNPFMKSRDFEDYKKFQKLILKIVTSRTL